MKLRAGTVIRIPNFDENGEPGEVVIPGAVSKRCEWLREQIWDERMCNVFRDPETGEVYIDPRKEG